MSRPKISKTIVGDPEIGDGIIISKNGMSKIMYRAVLGWNHTDDTREGLVGGKLWCWVQGNSFHVYDQSYNRSKDAGVVVDCGHANFTMVRMFHPYWCDNNEAPKDMDVDDKRSCREKYRNLLLRWKETGNGVEDVPDELIRTRVRRRPARGTPIFVNRGRRARPRGGRTATRSRNAASLREVAAARRAARPARRTDRAHSNSMFHSDREDNDSDDSDSDGGGCGGGSQAMNPASQAYSDMSATAIAGILSQTSPDPVVPVNQHRTGSQRLRDGAARNITPLLGSGRASRQPTERNDGTPTPAGRGDMTGVASFPALPVLERMTLSPLRMSGFSTRVASLGPGNSSRGSLRATPLRSPFHEHRRVSCSPVRTEINKLRSPSIFGRGFDFPRIKQEVSSQLSDCLNNRAHRVAFREVQELHPTTGAQRLVVKLEDSDSEEEPQVIGSNGSQKRRKNKSLVCEVIELD